MTMKLQLVFPELRLTGQYKLSGKIFSLVMEGSGPFWAILSWFLRFINNPKLYSNFISNLMYRLGNVTLDFNQPLVVKETPAGQIIQIEERNMPVDYGKMRIRLNK